MNDGSEAPQTQHPSSPTALPDLGMPASQPSNSPNAAPGHPDAPLQGGSIRLFRVAGIDVLLHWSWFFFALLRLQSTGSDDPFQPVQYDAQLWYGVEYLALFGFVLLHEFGHVLACRSVGGIAHYIVLWPFGGIALVDPPARPGAHLWSIAAGPLVNALLVAPTIGFWFVCRTAGWQETAPDVYRFAVALVWINGYLLAFNLLPIYPLDGGRILQALLWFVMSRAHSLLVAGVVSLVTAVGLLGFAIVAQSLVWGILAVLGLLFSLIGFQGARALIRMLNAPRREGAACAACGAPPPQGNFWACGRCWTMFDVFATGGYCPNCSTPLGSVLCPECGRSRPYLEWNFTGIAHAPPTGDGQAGRTRADPGPVMPAPAPRPPTVRQRLVWGTIFAACALGLCGLPSAEKQPLGLIVWTAGGAILGATSAGTMTRAWRSAQARKKLRGTWRLVAEDGQTIDDDNEKPQRLILKVPIYEERLGDARAARGACWTDALAEPPAISFTPKARPNVGTPRQGIYRLEGETLTICLAYPAQPRPTAFVAQPEVQQVRVYRRGVNPRPGAGAPERT